MTLYKLDFSKRQYGSKLEFLDNSFWMFLILIFNKIYETVREKFLHKLQFFMDHYRCKLELSNILCKSSIPNFKKICPMV
jgi:hypothetical protein